MNVSNKRVPHEGDPASRIWIVGEFPSEDDDYYGKPFTGRAGDTLDYLLGQAGVLRTDCYLANVSNYHPKSGDWIHLENSPRLMESKSELLSLLRQYNPAVIIALGERALEFFTGMRDVHKRRGSVYQYARSFVVAAQHPAFIGFDGAAIAVLEFDIRKAKRVADVGYASPRHDFHIDPQGADLMNALEACENAEWVALDIESIKGTSHILCIGAAISESKAWCFKNHAPAGTGLLDPTFEQTLSRLCASPAKKIFHNGNAFDYEMLRINGVEVTNFAWDTMLAQHALEPELPLGLDFLTSIYTDEPYYKDEGKENSARFKDTLWEYNCKDVIITYQSFRAQERAMDDIAKAQLQHSMEMIEVTQEMTETGMILDVDRQKILDELVTKKLHDDIRIICGLLQEEVNLNSHHQVKDILYKRFKLPVRRNRKGGITSDEDAIVSLMQFCKKELDARKTEKGKQDWKLKLAVLRLILRYRENAKLLSSYINIKACEDGRVRSMYKIAGTETGRWSCGLYVDGTGLNAQTFPRGAVE